MSGRRAVSLYYGSIGMTRAVRSLWIALSGTQRKAAYYRLELAQRVNEAYETGDLPVFAFGSARSALAVCLRASGLRSGDEVVVSSYSCLAVPTGVIAAGGTPAYADIDPSTLNVDAETVLRAITERTRAIVVQHTLGSVAPVEQIIRAVASRGILVIEDCALAVGSRSGGVLVGTTADAAIFSMELSKTLSSGWGGILLVKDKELSGKVSRIYETLPEPSASDSRRDMIQTAVSALCHHPALYDIFGKYLLFLAFRRGWFRRSTPIPELGGEVAHDFVRRRGAPQARLAAVQWKDFAALTRQCEANGAAIRDTLAALDIAMPGAPGPDDQSVSPRVSFLVRDRTATSSFFARFGVELGEWFNGPLSPVPTVPAFNYSPGSYPLAERLAQQVVNLPSHSGISEAGMARILSTLRSFERANPDSPVRAAEFSA